MFEKLKGKVTKKAVKEVIDNAKESLTNNGLSLQTLAVICVLGIVAIHYAPKAILMFAIGLLIGMYLK